MINRSYGPSPSALLGEGMIWEIATAENEKTARQSTEIFFNIK
jgi:hypothetical protein